MKYLILVGACYIDTILTVPHYPEEDLKLRANNLVKRRGGNCPNTLEVFQQLLESDDEGNSKIYPRLLAVLPKHDSVDGKLIASSFGKENEHLLEWCILRDESEAAASSFILKSQEKDTRTIVNYNELQEMTFDEFKSLADTLGDDACCYHFEGREMNVIGECIRYLKRSHPSVKVSLEVEKPARPGLKEMIPEADMLFFSKSWAVHEGFCRDGSELIEWEMKQQPFHIESFMTCTWGDAGAWGVDRRLGDTVQHSSSALPKGATVVDTIGAGDTFTAGILFATFCRPQWNLQQKLEFATNLAGRKVAQEGFSGIGQALSDHSKVMKT